MQEVKELEDGKIVELFLSRDESAISEAAEKYGARLRALARGMVQSDETAEECENDTYWEAWCAIPPHEPRGYLYPFLARITRHLALNCCRSRKQLKRSAHIEELTVELQQCVPANRTEDVVDAMALREALNGFLKMLTEEKRTVFLRRYWYLDDIAEIAFTCSMSESKVKTMLYRTRRALRTYLEKEGYSP